MQNTFFSHIIYNQITIKNFTNLLLPFFNKCCNKGNKFVQPHYLESVDKKANVSKRVRNRTSTTPPSKPIILFKL